MRVSTRGDYASRALLSLALHEDESAPTSVRDIAERTGLRQPYLEQILLALKGAGLVRSKRGVGGGYVLARPATQITLGEIVSAVDGPIAVGHFGLPHENGACDHEGQCVLLGVWADAGSVMRHHLDSFTLSDMVLRARGASAGTAAAAAAIQAGTLARAGQADGFARPAPPEDGTGGVGDPGPAGDRDGLERTAGTGGTRGPVEATDPPGQAPTSAGDRGAGASDSGLTSAPGPVPAPAPLEPSGLQPVASPR